MGVAWENGGTGSWGGGASDAELAAHEADTTVIHGITDTSKLSADPTWFTLKPLAFIEAASPPTYGLVSASQVGTWVVEPSAVGQGDFNAAAAAAPAGLILYNTVPAINDSVTMRPVYLEAGTYTFDMLGVKGLAYGVSTMYMDGNSVGTTDWYNATTVYNSHGVIPSIAVTKGEHTFKFTVTSKNASASNYYVQFSTLALVRTA